MEDSRERSPTRTARARTLAGLALVALLAGATAASAHHGEVVTGEDEFGTLGAQNTGGTLSTDTELTPVGKPGEQAGWQQIGGSLWRSDGSIADLASPGPGQDSPTPYDLDFYGLGFLKVDVAMTNGLSQEAAGIEAQTNGFAVGAQCRRDPKNPDTPVPADQVEGCKRIPVIYRYHRDDFAGINTWEESYPAGDKTGPGFVAAVTWLTPHRALAVGGTGTYPRREQELSPGQIQGCEDEASFAEQQALQAGPKAAPGAAADAAAEVTKNPPDSITGTVTVGVGPNSPFFSPATLGQWPTSVTFKAGAFEATLNTRMSGITAAQQLGGQSASTPLGRASFDSNGSLSISAANGALYTNSAALNPPTRAVRRPVYERELEKCVAEKRVQNDLETGAGTARAWLYTEDPETKVGSWRELRNEPDPEEGFTGKDEDEIPDAMHALHAIDASPRPKDCGAQYTQECAVAGGMRQLWHFADGEFTRGYGPELGTPPGDGIAETSTSSASNFRFRVRDIRFAPNWGIVGNQPVPRTGNPLSIYAAAVTSGCCAEDRSGDRPARLSLGDSGWSAALGPELGTIAGTSQSDVLGDSGSFNPDSYYALTVLRYVVDSISQGDSLNGSTLRTPGGPSERYSPREPPSRFGCGTEFCAIDSTIRLGTAGTTLSSLRLVSADGWAVGVLRSSGRGVAYTTPGGNRLILPSVGSTYLAHPNQCGGEDAEGDQLVPGAGQGVCNFEAYQRKNASKALYTLTSYALNAYRVAGEDPVAGEEGVGWAVGDHGAIATRGGGVATAEAPPARRGAKSAPQPLSKEAFDRHREEITDEPGSVPALIPGTLPVEPGFHDGQGGSAERIVMSRDGSEGWAFGASEIYRYDGVRWAPCERLGVADLIPPDPACADTPLAGEIRALARVPLERDADPTNDDEFEAVALTGSGFYRYRNRRWSLDKKLSEGSPSGAGLSVAFLAPDDIWAVAPVRAGSAGASTEIDVRHFDGESWVPCTRIGNASAPEECADDASRLRIRGLCGGGSARLAVAGERVYLYTTRDLGPRAPAGGPLLPCAGAEPDPYPVILYRDADRPCEALGDPGCWQGGSDPDLSDGYNPTDGGWDPGCVRKEQAAPGSGQSGEVCAGTDNTAEQGQIASLAVAQDADGGFEGWALGSFGGLDKDAPALMMRLGERQEAGGPSDFGAGAWRPWTVRDAADDYLRYPQTSVAQRQQLTLPAESGRRSAFMFLSGLIGTRLSGAFARARAPALAFDPERRRWTAIPTPWRVSDSFSAGRDSDVDALAPDGRGGFWAAGRRGLHHYTDSAPRPVFSEAASPAGAAGRRVRALGAGADGTVWLGDDAGGVYRYDRIAGWSSRVEIPGWAPARATARAPVSAITLGPAGEGVAVGPGGRIANLGERVGLDPAATIGCNPQAPVPPCGTGRDLLAAAVAPDGSAIVAGQNRALLWRPAGGEFRPLADPPPVPLATRIVEVEMPSPERAYLLTGTGTFGRNPSSRVIRGEMSAPGRWRWQIEVGDSGGAPDPLTASDGFPGHAAIRDIALDASGRGYAVGDSGLLLERTEDSESPWRRIDSGVGRHPLTAVALPEGGGEGALIGGAQLILTQAEEHFEVARHFDPNDPITGTVSDVALTPGYAAGEVEAWALKGQALLHHPAQPADPRLDPSRGLAALSDAPAPRAGELAFAALGKQDCEVNAFASRLGNDVSCGPPDGANRVTADLVSRRIREELAGRAEDEAKPRFALFTGDAVDAPGGRETFFGPVFPGFQFARTPLDTNLKHRRWVELVADPLAAQGLPTFGAIGGLDVARGAEWCTTNSFLVLSFGNCPQRRLDELRDQLGAQGGLSLPWRATMAAMPAPWQREQEAGGLRFERVGAGALSQRAPDQPTPEARASAPLNVVSVRGESYPLDSGETHYAVDVIDEATDEKVARIVVVDTSMRSIAASDPQQHPIEAGGQLRWLEEVLCFEGSAEDTDGDVRDCTREEGQQAIVLSNTPTYSYGPISPDETQTDAATFEAVLLKNQVNAVVSGRLGWQGRYWTLAPGVHAPCPGQAYRPDSKPPSLTDTEICGANAAGSTEAPDPNEVVEALPRQAEDAAGLAGRGAIPFVVSSTAGGRFNVRAERGGFATAANGFWRGYSIVRLSPDGDPAETIVEQRPILDWVGLGASDPAVAPGQKLQLQSFAREAFGLDTAPRYYEIPETQVITHRWHLLAADPKQPWVAKPSAEGPCAPYECLPERVGTIDPDTGEVRAGNGKYPDTFAIATLSVGRHVAAQPLVFTKSPSFVVNPAGSLAEVPPPPTETGTASAPPPPPGSPAPNVPQAHLPTPPPVPPIAPLQAAQPPEPQPPTPPVPPPPSEAPAPISLTLAPPGITVATPTAVIQPPTPPVNPAPPGGARREARQRQAATQKSGADSETGAEGQDGGVDLVQNPGAHGSAMTRRDRTRPEPSFTALARADQPSAWTQGALYGGSIALMALALSLACASRGTGKPRGLGNPSPAAATVGRSRRQPRF